MPSPGDPATVRLTAADLLAGLPAAIIGVVALASLILAHAHHHSLGGVLAITLVVLIACGLLAARSMRRGTVTITADTRAVIAVLACGLFALVLFYPGFSFGVADKDAGGYVSHAVEIARTGSYSFHDPALAAAHTHGLPVQIESPGARLPGVWIRNQSTGLIVPQFYHLWPALLATGYDIGHFGGMQAVGPLVLAAAVMALVGMLRRLVGILAATAGGLLLAADMLEVWQAKFPTTEGLAQLFFIAALFAVVVSIQTGSLAAAGLAGSMVGLSFLNRADGWLLVMGAIGLCAVLVAVRRADRRTLSFGAGLGVLLPYASWAAYSASKTYTAQNNLPSLPRSIAMVVVLAVLATAIRYLLPGLGGWFVRQAQTLTTQRRVGALIALVALVLLALGRERARLFGVAYGDFNGVRARTFDEQIIPRLEWFVTPIGFLAMALGIVVLCLRRWRADLWAAVIPVLVLFPIFAYQSRNSTRLMWWTRRYVPVVLPGIVILAIVAVAALWWAQSRFKWALRVPAVGIVAVMLGVGVQQSLPLRHHREWGTSIAVVQQIADTAPGKGGVFLFQQRAAGNPPLEIFAIATWLQRGKLSVLLPSDPTQQASYIEAYVKEFAGQPVYVVTSGSQPPAVTQTAQLHEVKHLQGAFMNWEQSDTHRPRKELPAPYDLAIYQAT